MKLIFADKTIIEAKTATEFLDKYQESSLMGGTDRQTFRNRVAMMARNWNKAQVDPSTDGTLFHDLLRDRVVVVTS